MKKGITKSGFEFEIEDEALNDMELLEELAKMDEGSSSAIIAMPKVLCMLLGEDGKKKLYDHVRNDRGKVTVDLVAIEFEDILTTAEELKN